MNVYTPAAAFDAVAETYDSDFGQNRIGAAMRERVWETCLRVFKPGDTILDLAAGTGIDATFLALKGMQVHAVDISPKMIFQLQQKVTRLRLTDRVTYEVATVENLTAPKGKLYDGALSNFGGLNCVEDLMAAIRTISGLLRPDAPMVVCLLNKLCLMEAIAFGRRGRFSLASRRWRRNGSLAIVGGERFRVQYPSLRRLHTSFFPFFETEAIEGLGVFLPPTWATGQFFLNNALLGLLSKLDRRIGRFPLFRVLGDHILLQLRRR